MKRFLFFLVFLTPMLANTPPGIQNPGIFRDGFEWLLDTIGNHQWIGGPPTGPDFVYEYGGVPGDVPIVGDWSGSGTSKIGIYRASNGLFLLDTNGNGMFDAGDTVYSDFFENIGGFQAGDVPVVGDWTGSGTTKIGIVRSGYIWLLDSNGDGIFEPGTDLEYFFGGVPGDVPVVGDWTGSGTTKIGVFRSGFEWVLDSNGDGVFDSGDKVYDFGGIPGDVPIVGDWSGSGTSKIGIFREGFYWLLDFNGNGTWDGTSATAGQGADTSGPDVPGPDEAFAFGGIPGDIPVIGKWTPQIKGQGGTDLATWASAQPRCSANGYYMPLRVYDDTNFTSQIQAVLTANNSTGAQRATMPVFYSSFQPAVPPCDTFYSDAGALPSELSSNFTALTSYMKANGYLELLIHLDPTGSLPANGVNGYDPSCTVIDGMTNPLCRGPEPCGSLLANGGVNIWCGSGTTWGPAHQAVYEANLAFATNLLQMAFNSANNAGLSVEFVLPSPNIPIDGNCADYDPGYCGHLEHHTTFGLTAMHWAMMWNALANMTFSNGTSTFPGRNQIYGFETGDGFGGICLVYTSTDPSCQGITGLYDDAETGGPGRPYAVVWGDYPQPETAASADFETAVNLLNAAGETQAGIIVMETWYDDPTISQCYAAAAASTGRTLWYITQWPSVFPNSQNSVLPSDFSYYNLNTPQYNPSVTCSTP